MKKFTTSALAAIFLFSVFCFSATAQTNVSGGIYADTTWTLANSPYIVVDTVVVFPGVTLTIQPGVTVKFANNKRIEIRQANLISLGTITDSITYTSNSATPTPGIYRGLYFNGSGTITPSFNYCNFYYGYYGANGIIRNCNFSNNSACGFGTTIDSCNFTNNGGIYCGGTISNCNFNNNQEGLSGNCAIINNCFFNSNQIAIYESGNCTIQNCTIKNGVYGIVDYFGLGSSDVGHNLIMNCTIDSNSFVGVYINTDNSNSCSGPFGLNLGDSIVNCQIKFNGIGIVDTTWGSGYESTIVANVIENNNIGIKTFRSIGNIYCNKICNNTTYNLYYKVAYGSNANFQNNNWCSTDSVAIDSTIYDGYDDINLGLVHFQPVDSIGCYLTGCNLGVSATVTNATCDTCHNGRATAVITNGHAPYTYTWYTSPIQYTATATMLSSGTYQLCVVDGNGCTACNNHIFVDSTNCTGFSVSTTGTNETCFTCSDGSATVHTTGGTAPFTYTWYTSPLQGTQTATNLPHGSYAVCVTDLYGCSACDSVTIGTGHCSAHFNLYPDSVPHTYDAVNMASGVAPLTYDWNWGDGSPHDTAAYPSHTYASAGYYSICLTITDSVGCTNTYCNNFYLQRMDANTMVFVNVVHALITGINESTNQPISIFPNPASDLLTVIFPKNNLQPQLKIFNMLGELKYSSVISSRQTTIDISGLANGVYLVEVITENNILRQKFIKQ